MNLITLTNPRAPAAEAYRTLRTNLMFSDVHTLVVTAPTPEVDKCVVAANLAVTLAQGGQGTILVDGDLRRPGQHTLWEAENARGLTTLVLDGGTPPLVDVGVPGLRLLPSGPLPPNPADLLSSVRMEEAVAALTDQADRVIFDAPPVLAVTDAVLLGTKLDGALLVVRAGRTRRDDAARAKEALERVGVRLVGAVLSHAPRDAVVSAGY